MKKLILVLLLSLNFVFAQFPDDALRFVLVFQMITQQFFGIQQGLPR